MFILLVFYILVDFHIFLLHKSGLSDLQTACHTEVSSFFLSVCIFSTKIPTSTEKVWEFQRFQLNKKKCKEPCFMSRKKQGAS